MIDSVRSSKRLKRILDLAVYSFSVTMLTIVAVGGVSLLFARSIALLRSGLFVLGILAFGYGSLQLWIESSQEHGKPSLDRGQSSHGPETLMNRGATPVERALQAALSGWCRPLDSGERYSPKYKIFITSFFILASSYTIEILLLA